MKKIATLTLIGVVGVGCGGGVLFNNINRPYQSYGKLNIGVLEGHTFKNYYNPAADELFPEDFFNNISKEVSETNCKGGKVSIRSLPEEQRKYVDSCFVKYSEVRGSPEGTAYMKIAAQITSLTRNGVHKCMATSLGHGKWLTARHCFEQAYGNYQKYQMILEHGPSNIVTVNFCKEKGCDLAVVTVASGQRFPSEVKINPEVLKELISSTELLIPGVEEGTSIPNNNRAGLDSVIMWAKPGGACIPYEIRKGCFGHTCSSLLGFSGASVYMLKGNSPELVGVHSGMATLAVCQTMSVNLAVTVDLVEEFSK